MNFFQVLIYDKAEEWKKNIKRNERKCLHKEAKWINGVEIEQGWWWTLMPNQHKRNLRVMNSIKWNDTERHGSSIRSSSVFILKCLFMCQFLDIQFQIFKLSFFLSLTHSINTTPIEWHRKIYSFYCPFVSRGLLSTSLILRHPQSSFWFSSFHVHVIHLSVIDKVHGDYMSNDVRLWESVFLSSFSEFTKVYLIRSVKMFAYDWAKVWECWHRHLSDKHKWKILWCRNGFKSFNIVEFSQKS